MLRHLRTYLFVISLIALFAVLQAGQGSARAEAGSPVKSKPVGTPAPTAVPPAEGLLPARAEAVWSAFLPLVSQQTYPQPAGDPVEVLYCSPPGQALTIPDNQYPGLDDVLRIEEARYIWDLDVSLSIDHSFVGDVIVELAHMDSGKVATLINRPGVPESEDGCSGDHIYSILDDEMSLPVKSQCWSTPAAIPGIFIPDEPLNIFDGDSLAGTWRLTVSDEQKDDTGILREWCLQASIHEAPPPPVIVPVPPELPSEALITGISGHDQVLSLDCEAQVAVDYAAYFGVKIDELEFQNNLPESDNPDAGFVGSVNGAWGQIPPNPYGVHAEPVAALLRAYGVQAYAHRPMSWDAVRAEIAAGRPVYAWVIGSVYNGIPVYYRGSDSRLTIVARKEHVVMVIGYNETSVTILGGDSIYQRSIPEFLSSWSALGNMAITAQPE